MVTTAQLCLGAAALRSESPGPLLVSAADGLKGRLAFLLCSVEDPASPQRVRQPGTRRLCQHRDRFRARKYPENSLTLIMSWGLHCCHLVGRTTPKIDWPPVLTVPWVALEKWTL